jgi:hypothetical protein
VLKLVKLAELRPVAAYWMHEALEQNAIRPERRRRIIGETCNGRARIVISS